MTKQYNIRDFSKLVPEKDGCLEADKFLGYKSSCFSCPFPDCKRGYRLALIRRSRNAEICRLLEQGASVLEVASKLKISRRTVQRIYKKERE